MNPVEFPESNVTFAKNQPQYRPIPAHRYQRDPQGRIVICWQLDPAELAAVNANEGRFWQVVCTFGNPLQPQLLTADKPLMPEHFPEPEAPAPQAPRDAPPTDPVENIERQLVEAATGYGAKAGTVSALSHGGEIPDDLTPAVAGLLVAAYLSGASQTANFLAGNDGRPGFTAQNVLSAASNAGKRLGLAEGKFSGQ
jgi:hypothetical protein